MHSGLYTIAPNKGATLEKQPYKDARAKRGSSQLLGFYAILTLLCRNLLLRAPDYMGNMTQTLEAPLILSLRRLRAENRSSGQLCARRPWTRFLGASHLIWRSQNPQEHESTGKRPGTRSNVPARAADLRRTPPRPPKGFANTKHSQARRGKRISCNKTAPRHSQAPTKNLDYQH